MSRPTKAARMQHVPVQIRVNDALYFMSPTEVSVLEFFPSGMPRALSTVPTTRFIEMVKQVRKDCAP